MNIKKMTRTQYFKQEIKHVDVKKFNSVPLLEQYQHMAFQARNLARASHIYDKMIADKKCGAIILGMAGSLFSAGLKDVVVDMIEHNMVDAIVSNGAIIVDQDFFEGLGFKHYVGTPWVDDEDLRKKHIDRIYDTYIDEDDLRICDETVAKIANELYPRPYSSREFIWHMGKYLSKHGKNKKSIVYAAYKHNVPIFVPAFSDCSAGFGLAHHQWNRKGPKVTIDSAADFLELTKIKIKAGDTGIFMIAGGVPKNFIQDTVVCAEVLGYKANMHKYAVQVTVADERDGALSGSTLKEAHSWGKVGEENEQMVYAEATLAVPLLVSYAYHKGHWKNRKKREFTKLFK